MHKLDFSEVSRDAERQAARVRIRAERRSGELIIEQHNTGSLRTQGSPKGTGNGNQYRVVTSSEPTSPKLSDLGITRDQSSQWQKLAAAPASVFEKVLAVPTVPTTAGVLREIDAAEAKRPLRTRSPGRPRSADMAEVQRLRVLELRDQIVSLRRDLKAERARVQYLLGAVKSGASTLPPFPYTKGMSATQKEKNSIECPLCSHVILPGEIVRLTGKIIKCPKCARAFAARA